MNRTILRPLHKIRALTPDASQRLFEVSCLGGRAKWVEETGTLSLKLQVSGDAAGFEEFIGALAKGGVGYDLEVSAGEGVPDTVIRFRDFTPSRVEFRSFALSVPLGRPGVGRYFIEGHAAGLRILSR